MSTASAASAVGNVAGATSPSSKLTGFGWLAAYAVFSFVMVMASESEKYGEIAVAATWVAAIGATVYLWNGFDTGLAEIIGGNTAGSTVPTKGTTG